MKNVIIALALFLALTASAICQDKVSVVSTNWTMAFSFGGVLDQPIQMASNGTDIFVSGVRSNSTPNSVYAVMTKFNAQHQIIWEAQADTSGFGLSSSYTGIATTPDGGCIWIINSISTSNSGFNGIVKLDSNGHEQWQFACPSASVQTHGDTTFVVSPNITTGLVWVLDKDGKVLIHYTLPFAVVQPRFTIVGDRMYLVSKDWNAGTYANTSGYVAELDWRTGNKIWSTEFPDIAKLYGATDDSGNTFIAATTFAAGYNGYPTIQAYLTARIDSTGTVQWRDISAPKVSVMANQNNWVNGLTLDPNHGMVILYGAIQRDEGQDDGLQNYYACGRDMETGDSLWSIDSVFTYGTIFSQFNGGVLMNGQLLLMGNTMSSLDGSSPNVGYLTSYDITTGTPPPPPPTEFQISQNYPNPFNPTTTISYDLPKRTNVTLKVYNVLGQVVATLVNEDQGIGQHQAIFDGSRFASGTYFYVLQAGSFRSVQKMMLVK